MPGTRTEHALGVCTCVRAVEYADVDLMERITSETLQGPPASTLGQSRTSRANYAGLLRRLVAVSCPRLGIWPESRSHRAVAQRVKDELWRNSGVTLRLALRFAALVAPYLRPST